MVSVRHLESRQRSWSEADRVSAAAVRAHRDDPSQAIENLSVIPAVEELPHLVAIERAGAGAHVAHVARRLGGVEGQLSRCGPVVSTRHGMGNERRDSSPVSMRPEILAIDSMVAGRSCARAVCGLDDAETEWC